MKAIERIFHPDDKPTLKFVIKKTNTKKFNNLSPLEKFDAIDFVTECIDDLQRLKNELTG